MKKEKINNFNPGFIYKDAHVIVNKRPLNNVGIIKVKRKEQRNKKGRD